MSKLNQESQSELAAEYANLAEKSVADWSTIPELLEFTYTPEPVSDEHPAKLMYFNDLVNEAGRLSDEIKFREGKRKELVEKIQVAIMLAGKEKVACCGYRCGIVHKAGSKKILPELLISQGVTPDQIAKATQVSKGSDYLDIRKVKDKNDF